MKLMVIFFSLGVAIHNIILITFRDKKIKFTKHLFSSAFDFTQYIVPNF
jgi:hypothetical protein